MMDSFALRRLRSQILRRESLASRPYRDIAARRAFNDHNRRRRAALVGGNARKRKFHTIVEDVAQLDQPTSPAEVAPYEAAGADDAAAGATDASAPPRSPLYVAAASGLVDRVQQLLDAGGAEVDLGGTDDDTPLHVAARNGHASVVAVLSEYLVGLDYDADGVPNGNRWSTFLSTPGPEGRTPCEEAARHGHAAVLEVLRAYDADGCDDAGAAAE